MTDALQIISGLKFALTQGLPQEKLCALRQCVEHILIDKPDGSVIVKINAVPASTIQEVEEVARELGPVDAVAAHQTARIVRIYLDTSGSRRPPRSTISAQNGGQQNPSMVRAGNDPLKSLDSAGLSLTRLNAASLDGCVVGAGIRLTGIVSILRATRADKPLEGLNALESPFSSRCCGKERSRCADFLCPCGRHEARTVAGPIASGSSYWHRKCSLRNDSREMRRIGVCCLRRPTW